MKYWRKASTLHKSQSLLVFVQYFFCKNIPGILNRVVIVVYVIGSEKIQAHSKIQTVHNTLKVSESCVESHNSAISTMNGHCYNHQTALHAFLGLVLLICLAHWTEGKTKRPYYWGRSPTWSQTFTKWKYYPTFLGLQCKWAKICKTHRNSKTIYFCLKMIKM